MAPAAAIALDGTLHGVCVPGAVGHSGCLGGNGREEAPAAAGTSSIILLLGCSRRCLLVIVYSGLLETGLKAADVMPLPSSPAHA